MVFQAFRRLFRNSSPQTSNLYKNSKNILSNCDISTTESGLKFTSARNEKVISYANINKVLSANDNELTFNLRANPSDMYLFVGTGSIRPVVDDILRNLRPKDVIFNADSVCMNVFNVKKGKFESLARNCVVNIFRESVDCDLSVFDEFSADYELEECDFEAASTYAVNPSGKSGKDSKKSGKDSKKNKDGVKTMGEYSYHLRVDSKGDIIYHEEINPNFQTRTEPQNNTFIWNTNQPKFPFTLSLSFKTNKDFTRFMSKYVGTFHTDDEEVEKSLMEVHLHSSEYCDDENVTLNGLELDMSETARGGSGLCEHGNMRDGLESPSVKYYGRKSSRLSHYEKTGNEQSVSASPQRPKKVSEDRLSSSFTHLSLKDDDSSVQKLFEDQGHDSADERPHRFSQIFDADCYDEKEDLSRLFESDSDSEQENKALTIGTKNNVFVTKGKDINMYNLNSNINDSRTNALLFRGSISTANDLSKILPHDNTLVVVDKNNSKMMSSIDLQTGRVSEEWVLDYDVKDCFPAIKNVGTETQYDPTIIGINSSTIFRMDTRVKDKIVEKSEYKGNNKFKTGMATRRGDIAVCSENGELRLYSQAKLATPDLPKSIGKRARNLLKGHNDTLIGMDITANRKYAICTYRTYLLFYRTLNAFDKTLGREDTERVPKRLSLKPEHVPFINETVYFTTAKFSTDENEEFIVASTGHFVISWCVADVLNDLLYNYSIKKCVDKVVADEFGFNCSDQIVVAMKDDVKLVHKNRLKNVEKVVKERYDDKPDDRYDDRYD